MTASLLIGTTTPPMAVVSRAAGFAGVRAFDETVRGVFAPSSTDLRSRRRPAVAAAPGVL